MPARRLILFLYLRQTAPSLRVGLAAIAGQPIELLPVLLVFLWTPPHFWALALFMEADYASAGVLMLLAVAGSRTVVSLAHVPRSRLREQRS